jgi:hypothetical protein
MPVHCPQCEAAVEAIAKFCLACGHQFEDDGPITSTGHDVRQLKEAIKSRDDLSMAEKFDLISKIEEGENPIELGIASAADETDAFASAFSSGDGGSKAASTGAATAASPSKKIASAKAVGSFASNPAAAAAVASVSDSTDAWKLISQGRLDTADPLFMAAMELGMEASEHIHDIAAGGIDETDLTNEDLRAIPVLKPPKRSFCPKCGSDIHSHTMLQWRKWREHSSEVVQLQAKAAMETSIIQVAASYVSTVDEATSAREVLNSQVKQLEAKVAAADVDTIRTEVESAFNDEVRDKLRQELETEIEERLRPQIEEELRSSMASRRGLSRTGVVRSPGVSRGHSFRPAQGGTAAAAVASEGEDDEEDAGEAPTAAPAEKKPAMLFASTAPAKKYEGKASGKVAWFLEEALETIYDPHGSGKPLKPRTILARSSDGNVRVEDVVRIFKAEGEAGLSELAWTSPLTRYIIEAFEAC